MISQRSRLGLFQLALALVAWNTPLRAQEAAEQVSAGEPTEQVTAPVVLDGITLFRLRGVSAFPAERRASEIASRIAALASDRSFPAESLVVQETPLGSEVVAGARRIFA